MASSSPSSDSDWLPEYDAVLHSIASSDIVEVEWSKLRDLIKKKIDKNIAVYRAGPQQPAPAPVFTPITFPSGGLKLPPFPLRRYPQTSPIEIPISYMDEAQTEKMKGYIFTQLDEFESNPPFTIQRLCELCLYPLRHYRSVGKYLRAVEKTLFVTSTWDSFPTLLDDRSRPMIGPGVKPRQKSPPKTPLFSPIPFLHGDARRSASTSPPPSPLTLATSDKALGMVDELDDPAPGHMSEHPVALTSVTTINEGSSSSSTSRPLLPTLEDRFVKADEVAKEEGEQDKENERKL